mgnify:CR=1 FL=1
MGTPFQTIYDSFLARINSDEWVLPEEMYIAQRDWFEFLKIAIFRFRFPRKELTYDADQMSFNEHLDNSEIQVLATYMKHEWIKRCISSWEEIKMLYSNKDFSQANHLDKLIKLSDQVELECVRACSTYSRSINGKPYDYTKLAGKKHG